MPAKNTLNQYLKNFSLLPLHLYLKQCGTFHNKTEIKSYPDGEYIITPATQWSYAYSIPIDIEYSKNHIESYDLITIECLVRQGSIGVMVVEADLTTVVCQERVLNDSCKKVSLPCKKLATGQHIVFRNVMPEEIPSVFKIDSIELVTKNSDDSGSVDTIEDGATNEIFLPENLLKTLRKKWSEVPTDLSNREHSKDLLKLSDSELLQWWSNTHRRATQGPGFQSRGWYQALYKDQFKGKNVADIGSGAGIDGVYFAKNGAKMTFVDISETNLEVARRLCTLFKLEEAEFLYVDSFADLDRLGMYDIIWCQGSMINAPFKTMQIESALLVEHLKHSGRWIELCYPKSRWMREGRLPFKYWGTLTDGKGTPWVEWYDLGKILKRLHPAKFKVVLNFEFENNNFIWFDLLKV